MDVEQVVGAFAADVALPGIVRTTRIFHVIYECKIQICREK